MIITETLMLLGKSKRGSWSNKQLRVLGLKPPYIKHNGQLCKGWYKYLIGSQITEQQKDDFLALKDKHLDNLGNNLFDYKKQSEFGLEHMNTIALEIRGTKHQTDTK